MDHQAFTSHVLAMERSLYRIARGYLSSDADCADAVQCALLHAWEKRHTLREPQFFRTRLTRILMNECKTLLRKRKPLELLSEATASEAVAPAPILTDALNALQPADRTMLILHYLEGYAIEDIAQLLRQPKGTVKSRLHPARKRLKDLCQEEVFANA